MYILELVNHDYEGTWISSLFVSKNRESLSNRIEDEKKKYIKTQVELYEGLYQEKVFLERFLIGELEDAYQEKLADFRDCYKIHEHYVIDGNVVTDFQYVKAYLKKMIMQLASEKGIDEKSAVDVFNGRPYESLRFRISEIEEV